MPSDNPISHYDKEVLIRRIEAIKNKQCYLDILELILSHGLDYTVNSNGIYFNLAVIPDATIQIIIDIVGHCENRKRHREKTNSNNKIHGYKGISCYLTGLHE
jgi:hypothetical protein